jgi:hypothetical protein
MGRMRAALIAVALVFAVAACESESSSSEPSKKPEATKQPPREDPPEPEPEPEPEKPAAPEPTTPEEIELARKSAFMDGRDADAIKYCEMGGTEAGKSDPQVLLGCALAACRANQVDKARAWAKSLPKALGDQARKICHANGVTL